MYQLAVSYSGWPCVGYTDGKSRCGLRHSLSNRGTTDSYLRVCSLVNEKCSSAQMSGNEPAPGCSARLQGCVPAGQNPVTFPPNLTAQLLNRRREPGPILPPGIRHTLRTPNVVCPRVPSGVLSRRRRAARGKARHFVFALTLVQPDGARDESVTRASFRSIPTRWMVTPPGVGNLS